MIIGEGMKCDMCLKEYDMFNPDLIIVDGDLWS